MKIAKSVLGLVGGTPLVELERYQKRHGLEARILAKLEFFNPAGSIKDRAAREMILDAERRGLLQPGGTIVEPTSGNTGIGLAAVAAARGYRMILTMPETMSEERRRLAAAYGAEIVLTDGAKGMQGAVDQARKLAEELPGAYLPGQFENPANAQAHFETTGPEIWRDTEGGVDILVSGVGTGGTITGTGRYLKSKKPEIKVVAVEPAGSPLLSGGEAGPHGIQGIGANFIPELLDRAIYDEVLAAANEDAFATAHELPRVEGILAGISSGAALWAAAQMAKRPENSGKTIVVIFPDTGERYLSTPVFG